MYLECPMSIRNEIIIHSWCLIGKGESERNLDNYGQIYSENDLRNVSKLFVQLIIE